MRIAVQEHWLAGDNTLQKFQRAQALGVNGVEVCGGDLTARVPALAEAIVATGVEVAAVNMGRYDGYISPWPEERETAINALRQAMADAVDVEATQVVFVPRFGRSLMPDLTPWRAPVELDGEMTVWLLRGVSDLAYAIGVELDMLPVNAEETDFLNRIEQAAMLRRRIRNHAHVKIAANLCHMRQAETDWQQAIRDHLSHIGYVQVNAPPRSAAEQGELAALAAILRDYTGWVTLTCDHQANGDLVAGLVALRRAGFAWGADG